jgi:hypothetical protein
MVPYQDIVTQSPFTSAFNARGARWMAIIVGFGSVCGILDTIVVTQYSMSRTFVILGRMGLVPPVLVSRYSKLQLPAGRGPVVAGVSGVKIQEASALGICACCDGLQCLTSDQQHAGAQILLSAFPQPCRVVRQQLRHN